MYLFLYFMQYLLMGLSLSLLFYAYPNIIKLPSFTRVLVGICSTPFALALLTLSIPLAWPKAPTYVFLLFPLGISIFVLVVLRKKLIKGLAKIYKKCAWRFVGKNSSNYIVLLPLLYLIFSLLSVLISNSLDPVLGHDGLIYFSEAQSFATQRSFDSIPGFFSEPGKIVAGHPHIFLYQAYLAQALMVDFANTDIVARVASQITIFIMFIGIVALSTTFRIRNVFPLALLVLMVTLSVAKFSYFSEMDSRDGFRIIAMLLVLITLLPIVKRKKIPVIQFLLPALFCSIALSAHTINSVYLLMIFLLLIILLSLSKISLRNLLMFFLVAGIVSIVPLYHYVENYILTGYVLGYGMYYNSFKGTVLWEAFQNGSSWGANEVSFISGLETYFKNYGYLVTNAGIFIAVTATLFDKYFRVPRNYKIVAIYFIIVMLLPISGWLDVGDVGLKRAMLSNFRYPLMNYSLIGVVIAPSIFFILKVFLDKFYKSRLLISSISSISIVLLSLYVFNFFNPIEHWREIEGVPERYVKQNMLDVNYYVNNNLSENENWIVDRYDVAYYSNKKPIPLYSYLGRTLFASESEVEIIEILDSLNVKMVCLRNKDVNWWPKTVLYKFLTTNKDISISNIGLWTVFTINSQFRKR